ncbi:hypothetical protein HY745_10150 [Candidatus Desantisbacteria bacterium]|nr:hypothetical protein [Candidatus Desantisbacteria bacterium]
MKFLLVDLNIGGGSTEFIIEKQKKTLQIFSINIGSVRMTESFISRFPISSDEYSNIKHAIEYSLNFIPSNLELQGKTLVGVAGTVTTLAAMAQKLSPYDPDKVHKYEISIEKIIALHEEIRAKTPEQIKLMKGIQPARSDVILAGSLICVLIMNKLSLKSLIVSESELLEGIIMKNI